MSRDVVWSAPSVAEIAAAYLQPHSVLRCATGEWNPTSLASKLRPMQGGHYGGTGLHWETIDGGCSWWIGPRETPAVAGLVTWRDLHTAVQTGATPERVRRLAALEAVSRPAIPEGLDRRAYERAARRASSHYYAVLREMDAWARAVVLGVDPRPVQLDLLGAVA